MKVMSTGVQKMSSKIEISRAKFFSTMFVLILAGAILGWCVFATGTTPTFTTGPFPGAPSYTVWPEGSTYFAKDAYGAIAFESSNASYIMNSALSSGGVDILLGRGTFEFSANGAYVKAGYSVEINLKNNTIIRGSGMGLTILKLVSISTTDRLDFFGSTQGIENVTIRDLTIDSDYTSNTFAFNCGIRTCGFGDNKNIKVLNVEVKNCQDFGMFLASEYGYETNDTLVQGCYAHSNRRGNIAIGHGVCKAIVSNNIVFDAIHAEVDTDHLGSPIYEGCGIGIYDGAYEWTVTTNVCYDNDYQGIYVGSGHKGTITANTLFNNCVHVNASAGNFIGGIYIVESDQISIIGNHIDYTRNAGDGILIYRDSYAITIQGNSFSANTGKGIRVYVGDALRPHDIDIGSNTFRSNFQGIYLYYAENITIIGGVFFDEPQYGIYCSFSEQVIIVGVNTYNNVGSGTYPGISIISPTNVHVVACYNDTNWIDAYP
jgi:parallel beta-helix repeat protein